MTKILFTTGGRWKASEGVLLMNGEDLVSGCGGNGGCETVSTWVKAVRNDCFFAHDNGPFC